MENFEKTKHPDIIIDRSKAEMKANCPHMGTLHDKYNKPVQDPLPVTGTIIHDLVQESLERARDVPDPAVVAADYFAEEIPKVRPDLQPAAIVAGRFIVGELVYMPASQIMGIEKQIEHVLLPATPSRGRVIITLRLDLMLWAMEMGIDVWDWKTGFKRRSQEDVNNDFQAQFGTYILWQNFDGEHKDEQGKILERVDKISFNFKETRWGATKTANFDRDRKYHRLLPDLTQETAFCARITEAVRLILTDCDDAWPHEKKCCWCDYLPECKLANGEAKKFADDKQLFLQQTYIMEELAKKNKGIITEFIKGGGVIEGDMIGRRKMPKTDRFTLEIVSAKSAKKVPSKDVSKDVVDITKFK